VLGAANAHVITPRTVNAIPTANMSLAGFGFGAMDPSWRQIDVAMPDFRGANWKRCMSYFTLRWLSKKSNVAALVRNGFLGQ
jgi:hypothetical protein